MINASTPVLSLREHLFLVHPEMRLLCFYETKQKVSNAGIVDSSFYKYERVGKFLPLGPYFYWRGPWYTPLLSKPSVSHKVRCEELRGNLCVNRARIRLHCTVVDPSPFCNWLYWGRNLLFASEWRGYVAIHENHQKTYWMKTGHLFQCARIRAFAFPTGRFHERLRWSIATRNMAKNPLVYRPHRWISLPSFASLWRLLCGGAAEIFQFSADSAHF